MKILTCTSSSDPDWNGDCDYALAHITPEQARHYLFLIEKAKEVKNEIEGFYCIELFDCSVRYFSYHDDIENLLDIDGNPALPAVNEGNCVLIPDDYEIPEDEEQRTDLDTVKVQEDCLLWTAHPKHTGVEITCRRWPVELLQRIAAEIQES